jgi:GNAT superfamily N-acetyltransferase
MNASTHWTEWAWSIPACLGLSSPWIKMARAAPRPRLRLLAAAFDSARTLTDPAVMKIEIETPGQETYEALNGRLVDFNRMHTNWGTTAFTVVLRDSAGGVRGGAHGVVRMQAVEIRSVWLDGDQRGQGFGRKIVRAAEEEGRRLGARAALLDSYDFQARGFYERLGYSLFGTFTYPEGVSRYYLSRSL